jgi:hypothetical protein
MRESVVHDEKGAGTAGWRIHALTAGATAGYLPSTTSRGLHFPIIGPVNLAAFTRMRQEAVEIVSAVGRAVMARTSVRGGWRLPSLFALCKYARSNMVWVSSELHFRI